MNMQVDKSATDVEKLHVEAPVVLSVHNVAKIFRLPTEQASGIKQALINLAKGIKGFKEQRVLKDISFDVRQGDFFGIVGRNGSGKSTLLKIISGIYVPEQGTVEVSGKLVPFIELGVGFNPELTGRENVFLNGALLGFSREEVEAMYDDIVEFAELEDFMDQKLKNYSSGMQVRLAFSVAIKAQGDILVLDEVLAVGDEAFQRKCDTFFTEIKRDPTKTVILVTHSMDSVKKYCNKAILIKDGEIVVDGNKNDVADQYTLENLETRASESESGHSGLSDLVPMLKVRPISSPVCTAISDPFKFEVEYDFNGLQEHFIALSLLDIKRGGTIYDTKFSFREGGHHKIQFSIPLDLFNNGEFRIVSSLRMTDPQNPEKTLMKAFTDDANSCVFTVSSVDNDEYALLNDRIMRIDCIAKN